MLHLEQEGILARTGTVGFTVRGISESEVRDIYQAREAIEGYAARLVAGQRRAASLRRIERTVEREESIAAGGADNFGPPAVRSITGRWIYDRAGTARAGAVG